jgi:hypothetical protein
MRQRQTHSRTRAIQKMGEPHLLKIDHSTTRGVIAAHGRLTASPYSVAVQCAHRVERASMLL